MTETVTLSPERLAELERRQTGGNPLAFPANDPKSLLLMVLEHGPRMLAEIDEGIEQLEQTANDQRALRARVEAMLRGARG